jgi:hypothetical protein
MIWHRAEGKKSEVGGHPPSPRLRRGKEVGGQDRLIRELVNSSIRELEN